MNERNSVPMSTPVSSSQHSPHKNLQRNITRNLRSVYQNSIPKHAQDEFNRFASLCDQQTTIILDSGCGTGESTAGLAAANPHCVVVGVDKSACRMRKCYPRSANLANLVFVRSDLIHFWRLLQQANYSLYKHYIYYPNPWPKPGHLQRRWHAHPVFPAVIELGGVLVMRTNWRIYAQEFAQALRVCTNTPVAITQLQIRHAISAFERKYAGSGHALYEVNANLSSD